MLRPSQTLGSGECSPEKHAGKKVVWLSELGEAISPNPENAGGLIVAAIVSGGNVGATLSFRRWVSLGRGVRGYLMVSCAPQPLGVVPSSLY